MISTSTAFADLASEVEVQPGGTLSKTVYQDEFLKIIVFAFDTDQELSEHTAAVPAILHFLEGAATVTFGDQTMVSSANSFIHMAAKLPHSIRAHKPTKMVLLLLKGAKQNAAA
ncbi:cupin domain-containing protein [Pirellulaceae bacterium SH501]